MREIVYFQVGQCGNQVSTSFWDSICSEHGIGLSGMYEGKKKCQLERIHSFFDEVSTDRYLPRAMLVDLDAGPINAISNGAFKELFRSQNCIAGNYGAGNCWAKGYYTEGELYIEQILDSTRKLIEACDSLDGFHLTHSIGGGTGSGLGSLIISKLREAYPNTIINTASVLPSIKAPDCVVDIYNALLTLHQLIENASTTFCFDNDALYDICTRLLSVPAPTHKLTNNILASILSGATASLRFPAITNNTLRKLSFNLVPFPRLHFLISSFAPLINKGSIETVPELAQKMYDAKSFTTNVDPRFGRFMTIFANYRGEVSAGAVAEEMLNVSNKNSSYYVEWIPNNIKWEICSVPDKDIKATTTLLGNSTVIQQPLKIITEQFNLLFRRRAFLFPYSTSGLEDIELVEAESNLNDLIEEYQMYQDATADEELEEFEENSDDTRDSI